MYILRYNHDNVFNFCVLLISQSSSWSLCQRKFSHSYSTVLSQKYPTLHCQQFWLFFRDHFRWLAEVWVRCEHPYRPLSLSVSQSLSLSCASLKCSHLVYMRLWSTECVSPQAQWVGMLFTFHPYLMQTASVNSCLFSTYPIALIGKADSQEDAPFPLLLLWVFVTQGSFLFLPKVHHGCFCIFHFSLVVLFFVSDELLVRGVVVKIELLSVIWIRFRFYLNKV